MLGEPLPDDIDVLPAPEVLERLHDCALDGEQGQATPADGRAGTAGPKPSASDVPKETVGPPLPVDRSARVQSHSRDEIDLAVEVDYPASAWDVDDADDGPGMWVQT